MLASISLDYRWTLKDAWHRACTVSYARIAFEIAYEAHNVGAEAVNHQQIIEYL